MLTPVGAMLAGVVTKRIPTEFVLIASAAFVCLGVGLLGNLPIHSRLWPGTYGYEVITGFGLGLASPPYFMLVATSVAEKDLAVGTGALNMVRTLGGCVAVAICSAIQREFLSNRLSAFLSPAQITAVQKSSAYVAQLPDETKSRIGIIFGDSYNRQFRIMLVFTGLNLVVAIILAVVRKRMGIFGVMPVRKEENEFTKSVRPKSDDTEANQRQENNTSIGTTLSSPLTKHATSTVAPNPEAEPNMHKESV